MPRRALSTLRHDCMLPFLAKKHKITQTIMAKQKADGGLMDLPEGQENDQGLISAAEDIMSAISSKNASMLAQALKAAFEICDEMPHEEGPHIGEEK